MLLKKTAEKGIHVLCPALPTTLEQARKLAAAGAKAILLRNDLICVKTFASSTWTILSGRSGGADDFRFDGAAWPECGCKFVDGNSRVATAWGPSHHTDTTSMR
jgi:hypothetical protein